MPKNIKIYCCVLPIVSFVLGCSHFGLLQTSAIALMVFSGSYVALCVATQHSHELWDTFFGENK